MDDIRFSLLFSFVRIAGEIAEYQKREEITLLLTKFVGTHNIRVDVDSWKD